MLLALFALGNEEFDDSVDPVQAVDKREKADKEDHAGAQLGLCVRIHIIESEDENLASSHEYDHLIENLQ